MNLILSKLASNSITAQQALQQVREEHSKVEQELGNLFMNFSSSNQQSSSLATL